MSTRLLWEPCPALRALRSATETDILLTALGKSSSRLIWKILSLEFGMILIVIARWDILSNIFLVYFCTLKTSLAENRGRGSRGLNYSWKAGNTSFKKWKGIAFLHKYHFSIQNGVSLPLEKRCQLKTATLAKPAECALSQNCPPSNWREAASKTSWKKRKKSGLTQVWGKLFVSKTSK